MARHRPRLLERLLIALVAALIYALGSTLRVREIGSQEQLRSAASGSGLCSIWHETMLPSLWFYRGLGFRVMISASRDGERIARIAQYFGYVPVRGSTSRGSLAATRQLVDSLREGQITAITPDGPRGPRRRAQPGAVAVARLSGRPFLAVGVGFERCWRLSSWDRFAIPKPFSRVHIAYGELIWVPSEGGSDADYLAQFQREMDRVTEIAEAAAARSAPPVRESLAQRRAR